MHVYAIAAAGGIGDHRSDAQRIQCIEQELPLLLIRKPRSVAQLQEEGNVAGQCSQEGKEFLAAVGTKRFAQLNEYRAQVGAKPPDALHELLRLPLLSIQAALMGNAFV